MKIFKIQLIKTDDTEETGNLNSSRPTEEIEARHQWLMPIILATWETDWEHLFVAHWSRGMILA
jgi:hypothetical protein